MSAAGATVVACDTAAGALSFVGGLPGAETVVLLAADGVARVATMTAFGPSVHRIPRGGAAAAASVAAEAARRGQRAFAHVPDGAMLREFAGALAAGGTPFAAPLGDGTDDAEAAVAAFMARRPEVPVTRMADGGARARAWSVAPYDPAVPVAHGMRLALRAEPAGDGLALRWRHGDTGADMGLHATLPRARLTPAEAAEVDGAWAEVTTYAYGLARAPGGAEGRTVVLVLDVPRALATGFVDGVRPIGGVPA